MSFLCHSHLSSLKNPFSLHTVTEKKRTGKSRLQDTQSHSHTQRKRNRQLRNTVHTEQKKRNKKTRRRINCFTSHVHMNRVFLSTRRTKKRERKKKEKNNTSAFVEHFITTNYLSEILIFYTLSKSLATKISLSFTFIFIACTCMFFSWVRDTQKKEWTLPFLSSLSLPRLVSY